MRTSGTLPRHLSVGLVGLLLLASCTDRDGAPGGTDRTVGGPGRAVQPYASFADCDGLVDWTQERMRERVTPYGLDGGYWRGEDSSAGAPTATEAPADDRADAGDGVGGTSGTNTQEAGVDEADISETDGRFVYSIIDGVVRSVDLRRGELLTEEPLPSTSGEHRMILSGDMLLVVSQAWTTRSAETVTTVYSVDAGRLTRRDEVHLEGQLLGARAIDGVARVMLRSTITDRVDFVSPRTGSEESEKAALEANQAAIDALTGEDLLPRSYTVGDGLQRSPVTTALACDAVGHPGDFSGFGLTWVATIDLGSDDPQVSGTGGLVADAQTVYASGRAMYVATVRYDDAVGDVTPVNPEPPRTDIHMFDLSETDGSAYLATGSVPGTLLSSYSMSEFDGHLRVASTSQGGGFGEDQASGVYVLQRDADELVEVGSVSGLGVTEQIQGVRFQGDRGYVVTFRQTDPLYVLDLSDPTEPRLRGELKIPGYSSYLHPIGKGLVIGVGYTGTETGAITGTQMSLFDVSDATDPRLLDTLDIGQSTEAAFDPHAFLWWPDTRQAVVPRELVCEGGSTVGCESAIVVRVENDSLVEQGRIFQWFPIRRSMVASGDLVTLSAGGVLVSDLASLDEIADIRFDIPGTDAEDDLP